MARDKKRDELLDRITKAIKPYNKNIFGKNIFPEHLDFLGEIEKGIPSGGKTITTLEYCAETIIIIYKFNKDGGFLGLYNPKKIEQEYRDIDREFDKIKRKINDLPHFSKSHMGKYFIKTDKSYLEKAQDKVSPVSPTDHMLNKIDEVQGEFSSFFLDHEDSLYLRKVDLKINSKESIAIVEGSMVVWRRHLRKLIRPKKLRRYSKLYDYLKGIFDAFGCTSDVETAYNNWRKIKG